jgi:hypothetical protein
MGRTKQIAVNAFSMASPTQSWAGLWAHPQISPGCASAG